MKAFLRWSIIGLAGLGLLVALFYAEEDLRGWHAWNKFKHQWEAKGEKFDFADVIPPKVPDDQNFALSPVWVAEIKYLWQNSSDRAESWYGDRVNDPAVAKIVSQLPVGVSGLAGNNSESQQLPKMPEVVSHWAAAHAIDLTPWQTYYRNLSHAVPAAAIPTRPQPQTPAEDVLLALGKFDPVIEKLRQDSALPESRFPVIYDTDEPFNILLPHLAMVKRYAQVLQLRALAELQTGQSDKAMADVKLMLRLADSPRTEPFLITHLVRIAVLNLALQPVWEGLTEHKWSEAQLAPLEVELAKLDFVADFKSGMRGELGDQGGTFEYLRRHPEQFKYLTGSGPNPHPPLGARILWRLIPSGWFYQNRLACARPMVEWYISLADTNRGIISPKVVLKADASVKSLTRKRCLCNAGALAFLPALGSAAKRFAYAQTAADLARVAVALERCRLAQGEYPAALDALAPKFIDKVPSDVINGEPLNYGRAPDGKFLLYSVGWNETDDNGHVVTIKSGAIDDTKGDWVWKNY